MWCCRFEIRPDEGALWRRQLAPVVEGRFSSLSLLLKVALAQIYLAGHLARSKRDALFGCHRVHQGESDSGMSMKTASGSGWISPATGERHASSRALYDAASCCIPADVCCKGPKGPAVEQMNGETDGGPCCGCC